MQLSHLRLLAATAVALSASRLYGQAIRDRSHGERESFDSRVATARHDLIGVWRVARFCLTDSLNTQYDPFRNAAGYFVYTAGGRLSLQFGPGPGSRPLSPAELARLPLSPAERPSYERGYVAYFGTYTVTSESTLVHHVEGGTISAYVGTDQRRPFRISGVRRDTLAVGDMAPGCRVLVRLE